MKKKLFFTLCILLIVLNYFCSNSYATSNIIGTQTQYDVYDLMRYDVDIVRNWMSANFSSYTEFFQYLVDNYDVPSNSTYHYFALADNYNNNMSGRIGLYILQNYNNLTSSEGLYKGVNSPMFTTSSRKIAVYIYPSNSAYSNTHYIGDVSVNQSSLSFFAGFYNMKIDTLFTSNSLTNEQIVENTENMYNTLLDTQNYLSDNTAYSDEELSSDKSNVANVVQPEIDKLNQSSFFTTIYGFYNHIINADTESFKKDTLDLDFYIFNTHVTGTLERNYTNDLLLKLCNNDTVTRNMIRNIIRSTYYLIFFLYFAKKYIDAFHKIITANFDGFHSGVELVNAL